MKVIGYTQQTREKVVSSNKSLLKVFCILGGLCLSGSVQAHQPRIVQGPETVVVNPEISRAYYGTLTGEPHIYKIQSNRDFDLYVSILVPGVANPKKDVIVEIRKQDEAIAVIGGETADWKSFFEKFGQSTYWDGGEYKSRSQAGVYSVVVSSTNNDSRYSLAIGELEAFDVEEILNVLNVIPSLKRNFFDESPISFIKSPFGWGYILIVFVIAFIFGLLFRAVSKRLAKLPKSAAHRNIGSNDRIIKMVLSIGFLLWAITTSWHPVLLLFSGFALFEALFGWSGFYAAIGRNTRPGQNVDLSTRE
jgi:hypothetical protein